MYLICKECADDDTMVKVSAVLDNKLVPACKDCREEIKGCKKCKLEGELPVCTECMYSYYKSMQGEDSLCKPCSYWGDTCIKCDPAEGCTDCGESHWNFRGICLRSIW